jgi:hypothetical protein
MSDLTTTTSTGTPATVQQLAVPRALIAATEPYRVAAQLLRSFVAGRESRTSFDDEDELSELARVDAGGHLICLDKATTEASRWRLGYEAADALRGMPAHTELRAAFRAIRRDLDTEPPIETRVELVTMMLDAQHITASDAYIQHLSWRLGDCPPLKTEKFKRWQPWFSLATGARAIDEVLTTMRPEYGRPVPIADVLNVAGRNSSKLIGLYDEIHKLGWTRHRLGQVVAATKDARPPDTSESLNRATAIDDDDEGDITF